MSTGGRSTIRDVQIRTAIVFDRSKSKAEVDSLAKSVETGVRKIVGGAQKEIAAMEKTATSIRNVKTSDDTTTQAMVRNRQKVISEQNKVTDSIKKTEQASKGGAAGFGEKVGKAQAAIGIGAAIITIATAPKVILGQVGTLAKGIGSDIGGFTGGSPLSAFKDPDSFTSAGNEFYKKAFGFDFSKDILGGKIFRSGKGEKGPLDEVFSKIGVLERKKSILEDILSLEDKLNSKRKTALEAELKAQQQKIDAAREEFGLFNARERQASLDIAKKISSKGVGVLSEQELEFIKGQQGFRGAIGDFSRKNADASGFAEFAKLLGLSQKQTQIETDLEKLRPQLSAEINLSVDELTSKLQPLIQEAMQLSFEAYRKSLKAEAQRQASGAGGF